MSAPDKVIQPSILSTDSSHKYAVITGGAGFIGTNLAHRLLSDGEEVLVLDNLSRQGSERNLRWLLDKHGSRVRVRVDDVRNTAAFKGILDNAKVVFHFAAQVAVTKSVTDPIEDFSINLKGTLNLLEELRLCKSPPPLVYTSTNKVYGSLPGIELKRELTRYEPEDRTIKSKGISEERPLEFYSPYGCSKGAADQYILDYARIYNIPASVFRMSCIYGPHQNGTEDQGWVAHFLMKTLDKLPITVYGDGLQVRDLLFVNDLVEAFLCAWKNITKIKGRVFNIGGGPVRSVSLIEFFSMIEKIRGDAPDVNFSSWRPGDQRYYVSDSSLFESFTGWTPQVDVRHGVEMLYEWLCAHRAIDQTLISERANVA